MNWTEQHAKLKALDEGPSAGKAKLQANYASVKAILAGLTEHPSDSGELFLLTAKAYRLKQKIKKELTAIEEEEKAAQKQVKSLQRRNRRLEKENKTLKESVKRFEDENQELKQQIVVLNAFREEQLNEEKRQVREKKKWRESQAITSGVPITTSRGEHDDESSSGEEFGDEEVDTFKVDVETIPADTMPKLGRNDSGGVTASPSLSSSGPTETRNRKVSKISITVQKEGSNRGVVDKRATIASVPETKVVGKSGSGDRNGMLSPRVTIGHKHTTSEPLKKGKSSRALEKSSGTLLGRPQDKMATVDGSPLVGSQSSLSQEEEPKVAQETPFDADMIVDIITGLEVTVKSRNWEEDDKLLIPKDYKHWYQFKVKRTGRELLKFKDFAPKVFYQMRQHWGVTEEAYLKSFEFDNLKAVRGEGKSGAFFIFTKDRQFVLKTATGEERDFLWNILPYYYQYMRRNPNSLLPRFYGVYSMKHEGIGGMTRFVVMNNLFNTPLSPVEKFDLKGSTVGRFVKEAKRKEGTILKDLDIVQMGRKLYLPSGMREVIVTQLKKDSDFLATHKVMDYSVLLGIYYETEENKVKTQADVKAMNENESVIKSLFKNEFQQYYNGIRAVRPDGATEVYYIGIIDILIQFQAKKKLEHLVKSIAYSPEEVSVVEPQFYSKRFFEFISRLLVEDEEEDEDEEDTDEDVEILPEKGKKK